MFETSDTLSVLCFLSVQFSKLILYSCKISVRGFFFLRQRTSWDIWTDLDAILMYSVICTAGEVIMLTGQGRNFMSQGATEVNALNALQITEAPRHFSTRGTTGQLRKRSLAQEDVFITLSKADLHMTR